MQIINNNSNHNWRNPINFATTRQIFNFDSSKNLLLNSSYNSYLPKKLILNLYNNGYTPIESVYEIISSLLHSCRIVLTIGSQKILKIPLRLLWELKKPTIFNNSICIDFPCKTFINRIDMICLYNTDVFFTIENYFELSNYVYSYSMSCKITNYDSSERERLNMAGYITTDIIQQLSTIQVHHVVENDANATSDVFQIKTNCFKGYTRGFFIGCNISDLHQIKFYINDVLRINYDAYLISEVCVKISNNLFYLPFNDNTNYDSNILSWFDGSINFSNTNSSILKLDFHTDRQQNEVWVSSLYYNQLKIMSGLAGLVENMPSEFICSTSVNHPVTSIIETVPNIDIIIQANPPSISNNNYSYYTNPSNPSNTSNPSISGNTGINNINSSSYLSNTSGSDNTDMTGSTSSGNTGPTPYVFNVYRVDLNPVINKLIISERNICNIRHELIVEGEHYMSCNNCYNNFNKESLVRWLMQKHPTSRTCPTCREIWANYDVYCNSE
jgi:hypothetical protein